MLLAAMQAAGTVEDTDRIAAALEQVHFDGIGGDDLYFDDRHIMVSGVDFCETHAGRCQSCRHVTPDAED